MENAELLNTLPPFHPSKFEQNIPKQGRNMIELREERSQRLTNSTVDKLESPGTFQKTEDDKWDARTNTQFLFKNHIGETLLTQVFFSNKNVENIQKLIRFLVHKETKYIIDNQSVEELLIVMRSVFLQYSEHPALLDPRQSDEVQTLIKKQTTNEVKRLNEIVLNEIYPTVVTALKQYLQYLNDASEPYQIMDKPINDNISGQRELRSITSVLTGNEL